MKTFGPFLLLGLVSGVYLSDPDSETVQDPSSAPQKSAPMIQFDDSAYRTLTMPKGFRVSTLKNLRESKASSDSVIMWSPIILSSSGYSSTRPKSKGGFDSFRPGTDIPSGYSTQHPLLAQDPYQDSARKESGAETYPRTDSRNVLKGSSSGRTPPASFAPSSGHRAKGMPDSKTNFQELHDRNFRPVLMYDRFRPGGSGYNDNRKFVTSGSDNSSFLYRGSSPLPNQVGSSSPRVDPDVSAKRPLEHRPESSPGYGPTVRVSPDSNFFAGIVSNFSFKMVDTLSLDTNFVISPLSIFVALSMCYLGSNGTTQEQLESAMGLNDNAVHGPRFHEGIRDLLSQIVSHTSEYQLFLANGLFVAQNFNSVSKSFAQNMEWYYEATFKKLDFSNPLDSVPFINGWISKSTGHAIRKIFDEPPDPLTRLLLLSAIYFKGVWQTKFPMHQTHNTTFVLLDGRHEEIPTMMLYNETFPYYRSHDLQHNFVKIPYRGDKISMIIGVPFKFGQIPMPKMTDQILCSIRDGLNNTRLDILAIPKFRLEHTCLLRGVLRRIGITHLFQADTADLSGMRKKKDVFVSAITHKAVIDINEQGTTASAATGVLLSGLTFKNITEFVVNRPFVFYIVHEDSGLVLFYGKVFDVYGGGN